MLCYLCGFSNINDAASHCKGNTTGIFSVLKLFLLKNFVENYPSLLGQNELKIKEFATLTTRTTKNIPGYQHGCSYVNPGFRKWVFG